MAKEVIAKRTVIPEAQAENVCDVHCHPTKINDNKNVIIAVGAAGVLFIVGLVLGYLLGHSTGSHSRADMMNSSRTRGIDRGTMPALRTGAASTTISQLQSQ